jgi:hypothetical protein
MSTTGKKPAEKAAAPKKAPKMFEITDSKPEGNSDMSPEVPPFQANRFGFLEQGQAKRVASILDIVDGNWPDRRNEGYFEEFAILMNKAYPHAKFDTQIMMDYEQRKVGGPGLPIVVGRLETSPAFLEWWRLAYTPPPARKTPRMFISKKTPNMLTFGSTPHVFTSSPRTTDPRVVAMVRCIVMRAKEYHQAERDSKP